MAHHAGLFFLFCLLTFWCPSFLVPRSPWRCAEASVFFFWINGLRFDDHALMGICLLLARRAAAVGEVPVGALVVQGDRILGRGFNRRETDADPCGHAEIIALRQAAAALGRWRLEEATLFVTLEPCAMCAGALVNARVARLVYGAQDVKAGAVESLYRLTSDPRLNHRLATTRGVRAEECATVLQAFFRSRRQGGKRRWRDGRIVEGSWRGGRAVEGA
jgi:tRNA(adenine34) deaminase